ncbi:hypothetical protein BC940DRAFT_331847 [Gongronella butleri]|nr:hypothetical protein BC940DRAFT_331847 [Gongronella butleri]
MANHALQSIADLTTFIKHTKGEVPGPLVGPSITPVRRQVFVFGGTHVGMKRPTNHMYVLDLPTLTWTRHLASPDSARPPSARYFHSATVYRDYILYFGGMDERGRTLSDVYMFNTRDLSWVKRKTPLSIFSPKPRYAHVAHVVAHKLVVLGGQDAEGNYIMEFNVLDLASFTWTHGAALEASVGMYRTVPFQFVIDGGSKPDDHLYLFANHGFSAGVTRQLVGFQPASPQASFKDLSAQLTASATTSHANLPHTAAQAMPPGLRFPHGAVVGPYLVIAGTFINEDFQDDTSSLSGDSSNASGISHWDTSHRDRGGYQVWALHLVHWTWTRIDGGRKVQNGSWNRGFYYDGQWVAFGNATRNNIDDYHQRQYNFDHLAMTQLDAFGIYDPPADKSGGVSNRLGCDLGLTMLNEANMADVHLLTNDNQIIPANSHILTLRWPHAITLFDNATENGTHDPKLDEDDIRGGRKLGIKQKTGENASTSIVRTLTFPESYSVTLAFLQYIYTDHLVTVQQQQPATLARLLILADMYKMPRLLQLATHALHQILTIQTASVIYEAATLTNQASLQVRALRLMMQAKKWLQHQQRQKHHALHTPQHASHAAPPSLSLPVSRASPPASVSLSVSNSHYRQHQSFRLPPSSPPPMSIPPTAPASPSSPSSYPAAPSSSSFRYPQQPVFASPISPASPAFSSTFGAPTYRPISVYTSQSHTTSSGSSSKSSHDEFRLQSHFDPPRAVPSSSATTATTTDPVTPPGQKSAWKRFQKTTIALAKPRPLRVDAVNSTPFHDL